MKIIKRLFGYCECCRRWFLYPKKQRQNTAYEDDKRNFATLCKQCHKMNDEHWDEMWADYNAGRL